jgi:hypothetical protein
MCINTGGLTLILVLISNNQSQICPQFSFLHLMSWAGTLRRMLTRTVVSRRVRFKCSSCFSRPTARSAEGLLQMDCVYVCMYVCMYPVPHFEACDWSTRFMRVISLGLSSVNRFCITDWDVCEGCVQKCTRLL